MENKIIKKWEQFLNEKDIIFVNESLNSILNKHTKNGYIVLSSFRYEKSDEKNKQDFEELKKDVRDNGFSFIPVYGGFIENIGEENEREVKEPSLFIPNYKVASTTPYNNDDTIKQMGIELSKKYNQDSFLFKPCGDNDTAYYINKNGDIEMTFNDKKINDLTQIYFTDLVEKSYDKGKKGGYGKINKRYSFTNNVYINKSPIDLNDAKKRYGELFIKKNKE